MSRLRILLTNADLVGRHGSVMFIRDLALALRRRGHAPVVFAPELGEVAEELRRATVPAVTRLARLPDRPDVIVGNSHPDTVAALLHLPGVPAVFVCHAWESWLAEPPRHPRIRHYVAVDETCRDRLLAGHGAPAGRVSVLFNPVDLDRFRPREPLPPRPGRALVFSNYATEAGYLGAVRAACAAAGLELEVLGAGVGKPCDCPEAVLGRFDVVFAKARCAAEALAVGCAVVLCDATGAGPLVTAANWRGLRRWNFGQRALAEPVRPEWLAAQVARYDPADAAETTRQFRAEAGLADCAARWDELLRTVAAEPIPPADPATELAALADYLDGLEPLRRPYEAWRRAERLTAEVQGLRQARDWLEGELRAARTEAATLRAALAGLGGTVQQLAEAVAGMAGQAPPDWFGELFRAAEWAGNEARAARLELAALRDALAPKAA